MNTALRRYNELRFAYLHDLSVLQQNLVEGNWEETLHDEADRIASASLGRESHTPRWFVKSLEAMVRDTNNRIASLKKLAREMDELMLAAETTPTE